MDTTAPRIRAAAIHPAHAFLLAAVVPLFFGALLCDITYSNSFQVQWTNFASWLIAAGLLFCGAALVWAVIDVFRADRRARRGIVYVVVLAVTFVIGFINALIHAKDVWAAMPWALVLSVIATGLAIAATWIGFSTLRSGDA